MLRILERVAGDVERGDPEVAAESGQITGMPRRRVAAGADLEVMHGRKPRAQPLEPLLERPLGERVGEEADPQTSASSVGDPIGRRSRWLRTIAWQRAMSRSPS